MSEDEYVVTILVASYMLLNSCPDSKPWEKRSTAIENHARLAVITSVLVAIAAAPTHQCGRL